MTDSSPQDGTSEADQPAASGVPTRRWREDLGLALTFLTRLPIAAAGLGPFDHARPLAAASWAFPLAGLAVGAAAALGFVAAGALGLPDGLAAVVAVAVGAAVSGGLHEDGLADVADGFGGGRDTAAKLRIMRDSRIGSYGVIALILMLLAKVESLTAIPGEAVAALLAAHALGRAVIPGVLWALPFAAEDGLARNAGKPGRSGALWAAGIGLALAVAILPAGIGLAAAVAAGAGAAAVALLARRQIGGVTGDVLGAAEQVAEVAALAVAAAYLTSAL